VDTLASPVLLCGCFYMATNNRTDGVSIWPARCCVGKTRHNRDQISFVPSASCKRSDQLSSRSEFEESVS
jgi:hypothetical protein